MPLTTAQLASLKAAIAADPTLNALPNSSGDNWAIADAFGLPASPDFWVWRTDISESDCTARASVDGTNWSWTAYIARSQGERDGWGRMFSAGSIDASQANVRQAIADIFSGTGVAATQRTHLLTVARRKATRVEKLFATGTGSTAAPATMGREGPISYTDVTDARNS